MTLKRIFLLNNINITDYLWHLSHNTNSQGSLKLITKFMDTCISSVFKHMVYITYHHLMNQHTHSCMLF